MEKRMFVCADGPWKGQGLCLESAGTLPLNLNGQRGRYVWAGGNSLQWEAL